MLGFDTLGVLCIGQNNLRAQVTQEFLDFAPFEYDVSPGFFSDKFGVGTINFDGGPLSADFFGFPLDVVNYNLGAGNFSLDKFDVEAFDVVYEPGNVAYSEGFKLPADRGLFEFSAGNSSYALQQSFELGEYLLDAHDIKGISIDSDRLQAASFSWQFGEFVGVKLINLGQYRLVYVAGNAQLRKGPAQTAPARNLYVNTYDSVNGSRVPRRLYHGQTIRLAARFTSESGVAVDPHIVKFETYSPIGRKIAYAYRIDDNIDQLGVGNYRCRIVVDEPGTWQYRWEGADLSGDTTVVESVLYVMQSDFKLPRFGLRDYWR